MSTVTVLTGPERRRRWSATEKAQIVAESLQPGVVVALVAQRHDIHRTCCTTGAVKRAKPPAAG